MFGHTTLYKTKKVKKTYFEPGKPIGTPFVMLRKLQKTSTASDVIVIVEGFSTLTSRFIRDKAV